jgi:RimJ/RimL family protein N-acetyltransferase
MSEIHIQDNSVHLRRYREDDAAKVYEAVRESIHELKDWFEWAQDDYAINDSVAWLLAQDESWSDGEAYNFAITDPNTQMYLGGCLLNHIDRKDRFANLCYWVRSCWTDKGVATAASRLIATYGFENLALNRIEIVMAKSNEASMRVAEKLGAKREGALRRRICIRGTVHDAWMYSLIPSELDISKDEI